MKSGSNQSNQGTEIEFCSMCGAIAGDLWQTRPTRPVVLRVRPRAGDIGQFWILCDECDEGLQGLRHQLQLSQAKLH
jgi:hypothetical protein